MLGLKFRLEQIAHTALTWGDPVAFRTLSTLSSIARFMLLSVQASQSLPCACCNLCATFSFRRLHLALSLCCDHSKDRCNWLTDLLKVC